MTDVTATPDVGWDQTAFDRYTYFGFEPYRIFDQLADVKPTHQAMPGAVVTFNKTANLAVASTAIDESVDIDSVVLADSPVSVTLAEYGNAVQVTAKLSAVAFIPVDPVAARNIGQNAGQSLDEVARAPFYTGTNVLYVSGTGGSRDTVLPTDEIASTMIRRAVAELRSASVPPKQEPYYTGIIHPRVSLDLREETGVAAWRTPREYVDPQFIYRGEVGMHEGVRFIETETALYFEDAGSSTTLTDVYATIILGREAIAKAYAMGGGYSETPMFGRTPIVDKLMRFTGYFWRHLVGYGKFREESMWRIETSASTATNT